MRGRTPPALRRAAAEPLLLIAAFGSILLAATTLVALTAHASSVAGAGVRRVIADASEHDIAARITAPVTGAGLAAADRTIRDRLAQAYGGAPATVTVSARSDSYALPPESSGGGRGDQPDLTRFAFYQGLESQARLVAGRWPRSPAEDGEVVEVAVARPVAEALRLSAGDGFRVVGRLHGVAVRVRVTGVFLLSDPHAPRWAADELLRRGAERGTYTTYGPLVVAEETFAGRFATGVTATWWSVPDLGGLAPDRLRAAAASAAGLPALVKADCAACTAYTRLADMLTRLDQAALVARSTMLVPVLQLVLLAAYALMLTARLLADHRRMELALLRSRGAGAPRLALLAGAEALLVALPGAVAAPFLAAPLLGLVASLPWIRADGVRFAAEIGPPAFAVSAAVAVGCAVLLALPAVRGIRRTYVAEQGARGRGDRRGLIQRAGVDVALLVLAALAIWQLRRYGGPVTATAGGGLGVDPLIVAGPALALLCGGMLGLRLVPGLSALAARVAGPRRGLAAALGAWQVSRRPLKYAGPALLLTMAVAIGVLSMATAATWRTSQEDQARHQAGADLRVSGPAGTPELGPLGRGALFAALPGVTGIGPVVRAPASLNGDEVTLLATDAAKLDRLLLLRPDLLQHPRSAHTAAHASAPALDGRSGASVRAVDTSATADTAHVSAPAAGTSASADATRATTPDADGRSGASIPAVDTSALAEAALVPDARVQRVGAPSALPGDTIPASGSRTAAVATGIAATAANGDATASDVGITSAPDARQVSVRVGAASPDASGGPDDEERRAVRVLASALSAGRPQGMPITLPGEPKTITVLSRLVLDAPGFADAYAGLRPLLVIEDALGVRHEVALGSPVPDGEARAVTVDLAALAGWSGRLAHPLSVRGLRVDVPAPRAGSALTLTVEEIRTDAGERASMPDGGAWAASVRGGGAIGGVRAEAGAGLLALRVPAPAPPESNASRADEGVAVGLAGDRPAGPLPVVVTADVAARKGLAPGDTTSLLVDGRAVPVEVAGIVTAMPGVGSAADAAATASAVLADLPSLLARELADGRAPSAVTEWWLASGDETGEAAAVVARHPEWGQTVVDRAALRQRLLDDPLAAGLQGALVLGFAAALAFAVLGFVVNAAAAARERAAEFAVLRALGAGFRQIFALLAVEQAFLAVPAAVVGTLLALGVAVLVVPHIVLTGQATAVTPEVLLTVPWAATVALPVAVAAVLFAIVAVPARSVHRIGPPPSEER